MARQLGGGGGGVNWSPDGQSVEFRTAASDIGSMSARRKSPTLGAAGARERGGRGGRGGGGQPARGRQFEFAIAPAGNHRAIYRDRNVWIGDSTGADAVQITTDGSEKRRIKYGTASWVYGEELGAAHGDVVVARRQEARVLSLRREQGPGFLSRDRV